ncbi:hypothetical protein J1605_021652 [Eschrichtius robustus]|uniref:Acireductone dioxygenase n=3 Tax=Cetacea TaxID=9721 RepID=A0AB34HE71_ESCRO|nr:hypothetical protein J1605_021652 [Eschrichtius robustus]
MFKETVALTPRGMCAVLEGAEFYPIPRTGNTVPAKQPLPRPTELTQGRATLGLLHEELIVDSHGWAVGPAQVRLRVVTGPEPSRRTALGGHLPRARSPSAGPREGSPRPGAFGARPARFLFPRRPPSLTPSLTAAAGGRGPGRGGPRGSRVQVPGSDRPEQACGQAAAPPPGPAMVQAWYMDKSADDPWRPHRGEPARPVGLEQLRGLGVLYWKLDADKYENDPELEKIRKERNYSWMDIITICKDKLPNYEEKIKMFYEEHLHLDDEIRYILDGSGYFDVRDKEDRWIRIFMEKGDMITLPAGIYHRFTLDEKNYVKAMRLFVGDPVWTAYNRPADHFEARGQYLEFLAQTA